MSPRWLLLATAMLACSPALASEAGMFLCRSPVFAGAFYDDLMDAQSKGIHLDRSIAAQIAIKDQCSFVASGSLKPVNYVSQEFLMSDGKASGWASPYLYIVYVNRPSD